MIQTSDVSQLEQGTQEQIGFLNSCVSQPSTHELLNSAEQKLKEAIALLRQAQSAIKSQGVESGWIEEYSKGGRTYFNYGSSEGGRAVRSYLPKSKVSSIRREIVNGHRLEVLEQKTEDLSEIARSLKDGVV